ncbi:hypothetical protein VIGAN_UM003500 [Vigna angularis var. angularis]|nr:hypothetical protein VIGAN_UM003500 [Vigna angularis var. angularis]
MAGFILGLLEKGASIGKRRVQPSHGLQAISSTSSKEESSCPGAWRGNTVQQIKKEAAHPFFIQLLKELTDIPASARPSRAWSNIQPSHSKQMAKEEADSSLEWEPTYEGSDVQHLCLASRRCHGLCPEREEASPAEVTSSREHRIRSRKHHRPAFEKACTSC